MSLGSLLSTIIERIRTLPTGAKVVLGVAVVAGLVSWRMIAVGDISDPVVAAVGGGVRGRPGAWELGLLHRGAGTY